MTVHTIGSDIEVFLSEGGNLKSAIDKIGGTKEHPFFVQFGNLQEDNVLAEFAIDPAGNKQEFIRNIRSVMGSLEARLSTTVNNLELKALPSAHLPKEELEHPMAQEFGCDPDWNAWTGGQNPGPDIDSVGNLRTAGGHIHVGYESDVHTQNLVRWMDLILGVPSVILDNDVERRSVYGKAGTYREKPYGIEYRVLSNFWIEENKLIEWAYDQTLEAYNRAEQGDIVDTIGEDECVNIIECINNSDVDMAHRLINEHGVVLPLMKGVG